MRLPIQRRLMLAFLGLAVVPLLFATLTNAALYYRQQGDAELAHQQEIALRVATQVDRTLRQGESALANLLLYRDLAQLPITVQDRLLTELLARHELLQEVALLDNSGYERVRRSQVEAVPPLRNRHTDDAYRIPFDSGETYYGAIHYNASGEPLLPVALPLHDLYTRQVTIVLTAELRLKSLWDLVAELTSDPGAQVYVLDEQGVVVANRNPSVVLRETRVNVPAQPAATEGLAGNRVFMAFSPVRLGQREFRVVAEHDWLDAMAPALNSLLVLAGVLLLALGVAFAAGVHVLRRIVMPIVEVEKGARAIAAGDLSRRVTVENRDEIGDLADSFNAMSGHLQRTLAELQSEISVRQQAEQSLRRSEAYMQRLLNFLPAAVVVHEPDGAFRYGNPAAVEFLGLSEDQLRGKGTSDPYWHFINEDGTRMETRDYPANRVITELRPLNNYLVGVVSTLDALPRWAYVNAFPDVDQQGVLRQVIVSFVDITERKLAEAELMRHREHLEVLVDERAAALRESEMRYRTVANFTNDWETWRGEDGTYRYVSPSCERVTGYSADAFTADPGLLLHIIHPDDQVRFDEHLRLNPQAKHTEMLEFRLFRRDGELIWVEHICQPVYDDAGAYFGTRASNRDVTDYKRQAEELARARDQAQGANRAKSVFLANMSHELRTPMNAILGFAQLLQQDPALDQEQRTRVETIARSGNHLLTLINDVLEISKIEAGKITVDLRPMDLIELLESIEEMIRLRAEKKGLSLVLKVSPEVPRYVRGDDKKLRQVLVNLLGNAVKFTTHGGVNLRVAIAPKNEGKVCFEVADTGCGIAPEDQSRIFEAFFQTAESSLRGEGTGLGLTISREYTDLMGGQLAVESEPGRGSIFRFAIPLEAVAAMEIKHSKPGRRVVGLAPGQPHYRILLAEDRPDNRELLRQLLESVGFDVRSAENGERALNIFHTWRPHLIWMDMRMPVMDGYEATRRIKASPEGRQTVVLALTASAFEEDRAEVLATGCDGFLRKPLDVEEVFGAMAEHLGVRYRYAEDLHAAEAHKVAPDRRALATVAPELRTELARASLLLDAQAARTIIQDIHVQAPELADALGQMVDDFRFDELTALCEQPEQTLQ